jgi:beta-lactamase regulating signal transducer with metallopeptidase domain
MVPVPISAHATAGSVHSYGFEGLRVARTEPSMIFPLVVSLVERLAAFTHRVVRPILLVGLLIAVVRCGGLTLGFLALLRARRSVTPIEAPLADLPNIRRRYSFASSATAATPHVLGFGRPLIVLPLALLHQPRERLRGIVLHEVAHVHRYDDLRVAFEALLAAVVWWDIGVRFAIGRIASLRERICDDAAVEATRDGLGYATVLADIARSAAATPSAVPCFAQRDMLLERVRAILDSSVDRAPRPNRKLVAAAAMVSAILVITATRFHVPAWADSISVPSPGPPAGDHDRDTNMEFHLHASGISVSPAVYRGTWTLASCGDIGKLRLEIVFAVQNAGGSERWDESGCISDAELRGMSASSLSSAKGEAAFSVVRAAGTFDATGHFSNGNGAGTYTFVPSAEFRARIRALGNGTLTEDQLFALTIADFQITELDALAAHGYAKPTPDELARLAEIDANPSFVFAAVQLPAKTKTVSQLIALAERGIRADDIAAIKSYGYHPTLEQCIRLAELGARPEYIARLRAGGYTDTNVDDLIKRRELGG